MPRALRLLVCAAQGRMGSQVAALAAADARFTVAAHLTRETSAAAIQAAFAAADAAVDFSAPEASVRFAATAARARCAMAIGTTGFSAAQAALVKASARRAPILLAANFSLGMALLRRLAAQAARALPGYEVGLFEIHHSTKRDAPSGTALELARAVAQARRDGRMPPIASQRLGDVVGEHALTFAGPLERLELTHRAHSRALFARGALQAALWLRGRKPGLYSMDDMLGAS